MPYSSRNLGLYQKSCIKDPISFCFCNSWVAAVPCPENGRWTCQCTGGCFTGVPLPECFPLSLRLGFVWSRLYYISCHKRKEKKHPSLPTKLPLCHLESYRRKSQLYTYSVNSKWWWFRSYPILSSILSEFLSLAVTEFIRQLIPKIGLFKSIL